MSSGNVRSGISCRSVSPSPRRLIIFALLSVLCLPAGLDLVIRPVEGGKPLFQIPVEPGDRFTLRYIHSVDLVPVWEVHSIGMEGDIYIEEERFEMFGAGMGHWEGHGILTKRGRYLVIEDIHRNLGSFVLRVGSENGGHTILLDDRRLDLFRVAAGRAVSVAAEQVDVLDRLQKYLDGVGFAGER